MKVIATCLFAASSLAHSTVAASAGDADDVLDFGSWDTYPDMQWPTSDMTVSEIGGIAYIVGGCVADQLYVEDWGIYACGGLNGGVTNEAYAYDLSSGNSTAVASAPRRRYRHSAVTVDAEIYVFGGTDDTEAAIPEVDVFNTATRAWRTEVAMNMTMPVTDAAAFVVGNRIHIVGGYEHGTYVPQVATQVFDLDAPELGWTSITGGDLNVGRGDFGVVQVTSDMFMAVGGFDETFAGPLVSTEVFSAANQSWTYGPSLVLPRADKAMGRVGGAIYVLGGETTSSQGAVPVNDIEFITAPTDTGIAPGAVWQQAADELELDKFRFAAVPYDGRLFVFGGQSFLVGPYADRKSFHRVLADVQVFDNASDDDDDDDDDDGSDANEADSRSTSAAIAAVAAFGAVWSATCVA